MKIRLTSASVCICLALLFASRGFAQVILLPENERIRIPRFHPRTPENSYRIRELSLDASIKGQIAQTQISQVFENQTNRQINASFVFPLPYDGAVSQMTLLVDGKEYEAKLLDKDEARKIYEGYVRRNQDPALLEWVGQGMFRTSVFPIPPRATRTVTLKYSQLLRKQDRLTDYLFPLAIARYTSQPLEKLSLRVAIESSEKISNIYSPTHLVDIKRDDEFHAVVTHTSANQVPSTDFRLVFDSTPDKIGVSVVSYWPNEDDAGYFILLASPELKPSEGEPLKKTVLFVVDQSGSMSGGKIEQAREAAKFVINNLRQNDLFNLISYDSEVKLMSPELLKFSSDSRQQAIGFVNSIHAGGMTNIQEALTQGLGLLQTGATPNYIVFLTDGQPTAGETNELKIAAMTRTANQHRARLITFGVGYDVNSRLLDRLSRENNGQSEYVGPDENIEAAVARLYSKLSAPVLSNVKFDFGFEGLTVSEGKPVDRFYPSEVNDMFAGGQIVLVGRYRKSGPASIEITGDVNEKKENFKFDVNLAAKGDTGDRKFIAQLWASRRIGEIIDLIDLNGKNEELVEELVMLSKKFGIVTPYTSYLADDQGQLAGLYRNGMQIEQAGLALESLNQLAGSSGFQQRASKQFFKDNSVASPQTAQSLNRYSSGGGGMGGMGGMMGGRGGGGQGGVAPGRFSSNNLAGDSNTNQSVQPSEGMRQVGSVTIFVRGKTLVADNAADVDLENDKSIIDVERFSDPYFKLVADNQADENLVLSEQRSDEILIVKLRGNTYRIQ